jgi:hypothetical protein|uniref:Uncharacterized protein n=1 Tax=Podoviridae sp. ctiuS14 TaxID=2827620 RepID=A0A8S5LME0_9CAUD|nr:MAG TPA: hypothetical protein [Podoviridae sp. ctiuS14]
MELNKALIQAKLSLFRKWEKANEEYALKINYSIDKIENKSATIDDLFQLYEFYKEIFEQPMVHKDVLLLVGCLLDLFERELPQIVSKWLTEKRNEVNKLREQE